MDMSLASLHRKIFPVPSRLRWLRSRLDRNRLGVEIGPCHNAVAPKRDGWRVEIVDHLDQEGLREKYRGRDFDVGLIERVDHVWSGQALPDLVGAGRASWVVASHVAEHSPDLVRFLEGCLGLLEPGGKLVLALPDHRRCFDKKRSPSGLAQVLDAWEAARSKPTAGTVAEHHFRAVKRGGRLAWPGWWPGRVRRVHDDAEARREWEVARTDGQYHDAHVWCFTPRSFVELLEELRALGLLRCRLHEGPVRSGYEFFVVLTVD